jgi:hypothetical protein
MVRKTENWEESHTRNPGCSASPHQLLKWLQLPILPTPSKGSFPSLPEGFMLLLTFKASREVFPCLLETLPRICQLGSDTYFGGPALIPTAIASNVSSSKQTSPTRSTKSSEALFKAIIASSSSTTTPLLTPRGKKNIKSGSSSYVIFNLYVRTWSWGVRGASSCENCNCRITAHQLWKSISVVGRSIYCITMAVDTCAMSVDPNPSPRCCDLASFTMTYLPTDFRPK